MGSKGGTMFFLIIALISFMTSCRTARDVPAARLKPMSAEKLLDQARKNAFEFEDLSIRRINVQFSNDNTRTSFRASLRATRDEKILASVSKLNIPVGRILLTPEDVTYINYIDRNYFIGDYSFLSNMLNFEMNFNVVQAVITNPVKTGLSVNGNDIQRFETSVEDGRYVLQPVIQQAGYQSGQKKYLFRNSRNNFPSGSDELMVRKLMFNPHSFVLEKMVMDDPFEDRRLEVNFSDFQKVENYDYPGSIDIKMFSENELTELNIKLRGFSTEKVDSIEITIPDRYQRIRSR